MSHQLAFKWFEKLSFAEQYAMSDKYQYNCNPSRLNNDDVYSIYKSELEELNKKLNNMLGK